MFWIFSAKFGRKMMYVNYLHELAQHLQLDQIIIPQRVKEWVSAYFFVISICNLYVKCGKMRFERMIFLLIDVVFPFPIHCIYHFVLKNIPPRSSLLSNHSETYSIYLTITNLSLFGYCNLLTQPFFIYWDLCLSQNHKNPWFYCILN